MVCCSEFISGGASAVMPTALEVTASTEQATFLYMGHTSAEKGVDLLVEPENKIVLNEVVMRRFEGWVCAEKTAAALVAAIEH